MTVLWFGWKKTARKNYFKGKGKGKSKMRGFFAALRMTSF
jgi:hypothetical protein